MSSAEAWSAGELNDLLWALPISLDVGEIAATLLERGSRLFRSPLAALWLSWEGEAELVASYGLTDKKAEQLWHDLGLETAPLAPLNLSGDTLAGAGAFGKRRLGAVQAVPMRLAGGERGWIVFARLERAPYTPFEEQLMGIIANRVAVSFDNARLYHQTDLRSRELGLLAEVSAMLVGTWRLDELLTAVVRRVADTFGLTMASIELLDAEAGALSPAAAYHRDPEHNARLSAYLREHPLRPDQGLTRHLFETKQPYFSRSIADAPHIRPDLKALLGTGCVLALPLIVRGEVIGAMYWTRAGRAGTLGASLPLASQVVGQIALAVENARLVEQLRQRVGEREAALEAAYEALAARVVGGRAVLVDFAARARRELAPLASAEPATREAAHARLAACLDALDALIAGGDPHPF